MPKRDANHGRLILHIGFRRTGCAAIQASLHWSSVRLRPQKVIYPEPSDQNLSHFDLAAAFGFVDPADTAQGSDRIELIERYALICGDVSPGQTVVISSEYFGDACQRKAAFAELVSFTDRLDLDVTVVALTRSPAELAGSMYRRYLAEGGAEDFARWIELKPWSEEEIPWFAYGRRLEVWRDHFEDVRVGSYDELNDEGASVIDGFMAVAGLECRVEDPNLRSNVGLHPYMTDAALALRSSELNSQEVDRSIATLAAIGARLAPIDSIAHYVGAEHKDDLIAYLEAEAKIAESKTKVSV